VIIFGSVQFLFIKTTGSNRQASVWFGFDSILVRFDYFILKTENYIVFLGFFDFLIGFFSSVFLVRFNLFLN